ncbi:MAG: hypothetical protein HW416_3694, partial [Chloroflexi bacterium]|nr:hypothetical protein [Chloroflexota bacterium]
DDRGEVHPELASELPTRDKGTWVLRPDGTMETTYKLRPGVTWHDGTPLTPANFVLGWTVVRDTELPISARRVADQISRIDSPDASTLVLQWAGTYPFAHSLPVRDLPPLPSHIVEATYRAEKDRFAELPYWKREFVGLGPYQLSEWEPGSHLILHAYDRYYAGRAKIDTITVKFIPNQQTIVSNLLSGAVDGPVKGSLDFEQAMFVKSEWERAGFKPVVIAQPTHWRLIGFQFQNPRPREMMDVRVRRGLLHAIDRQALVDAMVDGQSPVSQTFIPPDDARWDWVKDVVSTYDYDPRRAQELLAEVGWRKAADGAMVNASGERASFVLETTGGALQRIGTIVSDNWRATGLGVDEVVLSPGEARETRRIAQFPAVMTSSIPLSFEFNLERLHNRRCPTEQNRWTGANAGCYDSPDHDRIADALVTAIEPAEQRRLWRELVSHETELLPALPLFFNVTVTLFREGVTGVKGDTKPRTNMTWNVAEWDIR